MSVFRFWQQQDSNPRPGDYHADVLPLRHFDPHVPRESQNISMFAMVSEWPCMGLLGHLRPYYTMHCFPRISDFSLVFLAFSLVFLIPTCWYQKHK